MKKPAVQNEVSDDVSPELLAAHQQVRDALLAIQDAVGCPGCYARELRYVADAVEELIEDAEEAIAECAAEHSGALH